MIHFLYAFLSQFFSSSILCLCSDSIGKIGSVVLISGGRPFHGVYDDVKL